MVLNKLMHTTPTWKKKRQPKKKKRISCLEHGLAVASGVLLAVASGVLQSPPLNRSPFHTRPASYLKQHLQNSDFSEANPP
jgi:hypothetical protein